LLPGKPPAPEVQEAFAASYRKLKENKGKHDAILFMDATHPQHHPVLAGGWIKRGRRLPLNSNTGRWRPNINGVIAVETMHAVIRYDDTIDAESTIALFQQIEAAYPKAATINAATPATPATNARNSSAPTWRTRASICNSCRPMPKT
jgi:hypothetical protein